MKTNFRRWGIAAAAALMSAGMCMPAMADTKINNVKITLSGEEPVVGEGIDSLDVKVPENAYYEVDDSFFTNEGDDEWERGTVPVYRVELRAKEGYYFSSISKSSISVSGLHGTYKSSGRLDSGDGFRVDIKLRPVSGELSDIDENYWEGKTAVWEEIDDADEYEVKLYRGTRSVTTVTTSNHRYNLYPYMNQRGDYSFKVRAISKSDGEKSAWTELSDEIYISDSSVYTGAAPGSGGSTGGTGGMGGPGGVHAGSTGWNQNQYGWWYQLGDGNSVKNNWIFVDNDWFYLDSNGYMMTGLQFIDGRWFYLNPVSDGTKGAMRTGFQNIGGVYYYFNTISDGTRGAMLTSYQNINGNWYFFDVSTGAMWANRTAPNGKWIDASGVVH